MDGGIYFCRPFLMRNYMDGILNECRLFVLEPLPFSSPPIDVIQPILCKGGYYPPLLRCNILNVTFSIFSNYINTKG